MSMIQLDIKNQKPLLKVGKRGQYSPEEKLALRSIPRGENITLHLKALASKFNRTYLNVKNQYYRLLAEDEVAAKRVEEKNKSLFIPKKTVKEMSKAERFTNVWTKEEDELVMSEMRGSKYKLPVAKELSEVLTNRTPEAIAQRYYILSKKTKVVANTISESIPSNSQSTPLPISMFIKEENTIMYRAELSDTLHIKAQDAVKANVRAIIDSIPDKDADDSVMHNWFNENKTKVDYMLNINSNELWID